MTSVDLHVQGMTCASCANRIEKKLNKLDGVTATVNYATEKAHIDAERPVAASDLVDVIRKAGYDAVDPSEAEEASTSHASPLKLIVAIALAVPVIAMSMIPVLQFPGWQWAALAATLVVVLWCGARFHAAAWTNLRHGAATMDTLISLGTLAALGWSIYALVWGHAGMIGMTHEMGWTLDRHTGSEYIYLEAAVGIIMFLLLGRYLEERAKFAAGDSLRNLLRAGAKTATVLRREDNGTITLVERPVEALAVGDRLLVKEGQKIPTDGIIREGRASVDNAVITGESVPVRREVGDVVIGGAVNTDGRLVVEATAVGHDTQLSRIASLVEAAQSEKAGAQRLADKISGVFVPVVVGIALLTLVAWLVLGAGASAAVGAAVAVLIIACPCALGLATPVALLVGTGKAAEMGIAISGPVALERSAKIDTVVLDKTGTLTSGVMRVVDVRTYGMPRAIVQRLAAAAEAGSSHPVAKAIAVSVDPVPAATNFEAEAGRGVTATVEGHQIRVGSPSFVAGQIDAAAEADIRELVESGATVAVVSVDDVVRGVLALRDEPVQAAGQAVADLRALGLTPVLLTGDHAAAAATVAAGVGIDDVRADVGPEGKADVVRALQADGKKVAMVGDGVNDAAALATADLGIAMGTGTDVAAKAADMTLVAGDIATASTAIRLARATLRTIRMNLVWAFGYNVIAIPLAAMGYLQPMIAGAAMAASSLFVVLNSLRLKGFGRSR